MADYNSIHTGTTIDAAVTNCSGLSGNVQSQLDSKEDIITGAASSVTSSNLTISRILVSNGSGKIDISSTASSVLAYLDATSSIQNQLDNKEPTLTKGNLTESTSSILTLTGNTNAIIGSGLTIQVKEASSSQNGYLSSTDWNTFNNKQASLDINDIEGITNQITVTNGTNVIVSATPVTLSLPQNIDTSADTTFNSMILSGLTADRVLYSNGSKSITSSNITSTELGYLTGVTSLIQTQLDSKQSSLDINNIEGTSNQITVSNGANTIVSATPVTLSLPQDIHLAATPTFAEIVITGLTTNSVLISDSNQNIVSSNISSTTLSYLDATSSIQTQIDGKESTLTKGNLTETTSSVLTITGGNNSIIGSGTTIEVALANTSTSGYLSNTDWNTFNNKQNALDIGDIEGTANQITVTNGTNVIISATPVTLSLPQDIATTSTPTFADGTLIQTNQNGRTNFNVDNTTNDVSARTSINARYSSSNYVSIQNMSPNSTMSGLFSGNKGGLYSEGTDLIVASYDAYSLTLGTNNISAITIDTSQKATFAGTVNLNALTASKMLTLDSSKDIVSTYDVDQSLSTTSSPTFASDTYIWEDQNAETRLHIRNDSNTAGSSAMLWVQYSTTHYGILNQRGPSYSGAGLNVANSVGLICYGNSNGLRIFTEDATSVILGTSNTARLTINSSGVATFSNSVDCGNSCEANAYTVGGTAGVDFSGAITNLTIVKGIVTAAS